MNDIQKMMYQSLVSIRNNEVNLRWTRAQLFFFINSAALSLVTTQLKINDLSYGFACLGGALLSLLWLGLTILIRRWTDYWDSMLHALESLDGQPITIFSGVAWQKARNTWLTANQILIALSVLFIVAWMVLIANWVYHYKP